MNDLINKNDYAERIEKVVLEDLLKDDVLSKEEVLMDAEVTAFSIIDTHLQKRYDTRGLFQTGLKKEQSVFKEWVVSIVLHLLYKNREGKIPGTVVLNYTATLKDLEYISLGKRLIALPGKRENRSNEEETGDDWQQDFDFESSFNFEI